MPVQINILWFPTATISLLTQNFHTEYHTVLLTLGHIHQRKESRQRWLGSPSLWRWCLNWQRPQNTNPSTVPLQGSQSCALLEPSQITMYEHSLSKWEKGKYEQAPEEIQHGIFTKHMLLGRSSRECPGAHRGFTNHSLKNTVSITHQKASFSENFGADAPNQKALSCPQQNKRNQLLLLRCGTVASWHYHVWHVMDKSFEKGSQI